jgi:hypothetical protein
MQKWGLSYQGWESNEMGDTFVIKSQWWHILYKPLVNIWQTYLGQQIEKNMCINPQLTQNAG